jgi:hypothetical protein
MLSPCPTEKLSAMGEGERALRGLTRNRAGRGLCAHLAQCPQLHQKGLKVWLKQLNACFASTKY